MRRTIRLTGRRQLPVSSVKVRLHPSTEAEQTNISLTISEHKHFRIFPGTASIKLRLIENKLSKTLTFGTIAKPNTVQSISSGAFSAPSCQLRVVSNDKPNTGRLLGSSRSWTLRTDVHLGGEPAEASEGLLLFQPFDIAPLSWKLDIREDSKPIVYIDKRIPNSRTWARTDPVFVACVLPAIVREIFEDILKNKDQPSSDSWEMDWVNWADSLMLGVKPPWNETGDLRRRWVDNLLENFCGEHEMHAALLECLGNSHEMNS